MNRDPRSWVPRSLILLLLWICSLPALATVWGLDSHYSGSGPHSSPPTYLFGFQDDHSVTNYGRLKLAGNDVNADALAYSTEYGLLGFVLEDVLGNTRSRLVTIDPGSASATPVGAPVTGEMRGAVFAYDGDLLVLDSDHNALLEVDPLSAAVLSTKTITGVSLTDWTDLALSPDGTLYLTSGYKLYTLDRDTAQASSPVKDHTGLAFAGLSFSPGIAERLYAYEVNGYDEIYDFTLTTTPTLFLSEGQIGIHNNSGRGDLAREITTSSLPSPGGLWLLLAGLAGLGFGGRRRD